MAITASNVPDRFDVVFQLNDGTFYGFLFADSLESNLPFRTHKAMYSYSPTFLERENVSNQYGDNFQDFFLTGAQNDFSLGEMQKYFRVNDSDRSRRYWNGKNVEPTDVPGNVTLTTALANVGITPVGGGVMPTTAAAAVQNNGFDWWAIDNTNLYGITSTPTVTGQGAHGAGNALAITADPSNVYIAGTTAIKRFHLTGSTMNAFSATANCTQLVYVNNILYGYQFNTDSLLSFDTAGTATTQFQWKNADGTTVSVAAQVQMMAYGGGIYIVRNVNQNTEIWKYTAADGCVMQAQLPSDFVGLDMTVASGIVFISGYFISGSNYQPAVFYYVNGSVGQLWKSPTAGNSNQIPLTAFANGVIFKDPITGNVYQYDISVGGVHCIANYSNASPETAANLVGSNIHSSFVLVFNNKVVTYGGTGNYNSTGFVQTSMYDFDNTLNKVFRGLKVDADIPLNTSVDLKYQMDSVSGTYTSLQTGITSGTEYFLPANTQGHSISVQVTLNSATGSATPTLKRVYIRAAPTLQQFRKREYIFDLSGGYRSTKGKVARLCRDGTPYPYDGYTAANNLINVATQVIPFTVYDRFVPSGYTALVDLQQNSAGYDGFAIYETHPGVYLCRINLREV